MKTLILCGGKGTRAYPHTVDLPKPLLEVAGRPVLRHVMEIYASQGFTEFVLAAGFRADLIAEFASDLPAAWDVEVVDTGLDTNTGARVALCRRLAGEVFFATYGDGLGDVDLRAQLAFHQSHPAAATVTIVPLPSQYGTIECGPGSRVDRFLEKPVLLDHWINAGFFLIESRAFQHGWADDLERQVLPALGAAGQLYAYRHQGFWKSMDTYKDALELTALCEAAERGLDGRPPWLRSPTAASW
jgi:glucose-1-phosphate cytidylyltransferase